MMKLTTEQRSFLRSDFGDFGPFLEQTDFERDDLLLQMERQFEQMGVYSVGPWFGRLLNILVRFGRVEQALELGTATGYSAVWIGRGLTSVGRLLTIERDAQIAAIAEQNLGDAKLRDRVDVVIGEAGAVISQFEDDLFDFIFVDCAHLEALDTARDRLRPGGLFVCDNVGFSNKDEFNHRLTTCPYLETLYLHAYLKGRTPENAAFSISLKV